MNIVKDDQGNHKRVVIQIEPLDKTKIVSLQQEVGPRFEGFQNYKYEDIHMTLFHFGKPQELYKEVIDYTKVDTEYNAFFKRFVLLLEELSFLVNNFEMELKSLDLSIFDYPSETTKKYGITILFEKHKELEVVRKGVLEIINTWLSEYNITDHEAFYLQSKNFRYNLPEDFKPHVTLGRVFGLDKPTKYDNSAPQVSVRFGNLNFLNVIN